MILPPIHEMTADAAWSRLLGAPSRGLFVVHSPSAESHVARLFPGLSAQKSWKVTREPQLEDFSRLERIPDFSPELVLGIGGGRALDSAKVVSHWGRAFRTIAELRTVLQDGVRLQGSGRARLWLAPTLASSGSESSKGAIVTVDSIKSGLRGDSMQPDGVIHDPRLWPGLGAPARRHYAFDVFAHLLETTISRRRTPLAVAQAAEGAGHLLHWLLRHEAAADSYRMAMRAAYHAGICLASSSTCLPHRVQYILGPQTGTTHVEGIWMLSPFWVDGLVAADPARAQEAVGILQGGEYGQETLGGLFKLVHGLGGHGVRTERFRISRAEATTMAGRVTGDLAADPSFVDSSTVERLLLNFAS